MTDPVKPAAQATFADALYRLLAHGVHSVEGRLELVKLELADEHDRLGQLLTRGLFAALLILVTGQLLVMLVIALAWDTPWRIQVIGGLALASLAATLAMVRFYHRTPPSTMLDGSTGEIAKDIRAIGGVR